MLYVLLIIILNICIAPDKALFFQRINVDFFLISTIACVVVLIRRASLRYF